jgi:hypothetical protein
MGRNEKKKTGETFLLKNDRIYIFFHNISNFFGITETRKTRTKKSWIKNAKKIGFFSRGFTFSDLHFCFTFWPLWGRPYTGRGTGRLSLSVLLATFRRHSAAFWPELVRPGFCHRGCCDFACKPCCGWWGGTCRQGRRTPSSRKFSVSGLKH